MRSAFEHTPRWDAVCAGTCSFLRRYRTVSLVAVMLLSFGQSVSAQVATPVRTLPRTTSIPPANRTTVDLVLVAFTSSTCALASRDSARIGYERLLSGLRSFALRQTVIPRVTTLGVSLDWDIAAGTQALRRLGMFDEISIGQNWLNSQSIRFGFRDHPGRIGTPSALLVQRTVTPRSNTIVVTKDTVLERAFGAREMFLLATKLADSARPAQVPAVSIARRAPRGAR
jgi:hypothetical protein